MGNISRKFCCGKACFVVAVCYATHMESPAEKTTRPYAKRTVLPWVLEYRVPEEDGPWQRPEVIIMDDGSEQSPVFENTMECRKMLRKIAKMSASHEWRAVRVLGPVRAVTRTVSSVTGL